MNNQDLSEMNDEDIVEHIKLNKDAVAQEYIMTKYKPLVKSKARAYFIVGADNEDIIQEGMIGLYKAIRDYQREKNSSFKAFADLCITRQIITAIKAATRQKHIPLNSYVSLNKPAFEDEPQITYLDNIKENEVLNPETVVIGQENKTFIENNIDKNLSRFEMEVLSMYLQGKSYNEISQSIGKPEKSVDNALQRIKKKLSRLLEK